MPAADPETPALLAALRERVVVADGAMGTMLQAHDLDVEADFEGHEGCNEILNVTRPDVVRAVHDAYFEVGCDAVETNTFGANKIVLAEAGMADRVYENNLAAATLFSNTRSAMSASAMTILLAPNVLVSTASHPTARNASWISWITSGRLKFSTSEMFSWPSQSRLRSSGRV